MKLILITHVFFTLFMVGLIWFVQIVHYPLFAKVGRDQFTTYEQLHQRFTTWVVAPVMLLELATALALLRYAPPGTATVLSWIGVALVAIIWLSTWGLQIPAHEALAVSFSSRDHSRLVASNWIRTGAWTGRGILVLAMTFRSLP